MVNEVVVFLGVSESSVGSLDPVRSPAEAREAGPGLAGGDEIYRFVFGLDLEFMSIWDSSIICDANSAPLSTMGVAAEGVA